MPQTALKYETEVADDGSVQIKVPLPPGTHVTIFVVEDAGQMMYDLTKSAESSLAFWDNAWDDEDWNESPSR